MDAILNQIDRALDRGFHYLAVASSLTLPDICAALETENGETSKMLYQKWYDTWIGPKYPMMTGTDIYRLRSGVVHQGIFGPKGMQYDRIVFMLPGRHTLHRNISSHIAGGTESALQLDATIFCRDMIAGVKSWYAAKSNDPNIVANLPRVLQFRPNGIPPHFVGVPVIA
jgi:hypothetical protein